MQTRGDFIRAVATGSIVSAAATGTPRVAAANPTPQPVSSAARALADRMRQFDPTLTDSEIATIAGNIDSTLDTGKSLNPKGKRLHNGDEPVPEFAVDQHE